MEQLQSQVDRLEEELGQLQQVSGANGLDVSKVKLHNLPVFV